MITIHFLEFTIFHIHSREVTTTVVGSGVFAKVDSPYLGRVAHFFHEGRKRGQWRENPFAIFTAEAFGFLSKKLGTTMSARAGVLDVDSRRFTRRRENFLASLYGVMKVGYAIPFLYREQVRLPTIASRCYNRTSSSVLSSPSLPSAFVDRGVVVVVPRASSVVVGLGFTLRPLRASDFTFSVQYTFPLVSSESLCSCSLVPRRVVAVHVVCVTMTSMGGLGGGDVDVWSVEKRRGKARGVK